MSTYSELMQTINVIIAIAVFILNFVKVYHDIKRSNRRSHKLSGYSL